MFLPRSAGTLGIARLDTSTNESVKRKTSSMPSGPSRSSIDSRCLMTACLGRSSLHDLAEVDAVVVDVHDLVAPGGQVLADVVRADRQLTVAAIDHDRELHGAGAAERRERVERGADRPAGEEHVVDQH